MKLGTSGLEIGVQPFSSGKENFFEENVNLYLEPCRGDHSKITGHHGNYFGCCGLISRPLPQNIHLGSKRLTGSNLVMTLVVLSKALYHNCVKLRKMLGR